MARPLLVLAAWLAVGCLVGGDVEPRAALAILVGVALLLGLAAASPRGRGAGRARAAYEACPLRRWIEGRVDDSGAVRLLGRAAGDGAELGDALRLRLDVEQAASGGRTIALPGRVRLDVYGAAARPSVLDGDLLAVSASLRTVDGPWNPGGGDPRDRAAHEGVVAFGSVKSALLLERQPSPSLAAEARAWSRQKLGLFVPAGQEESLARAMVLGDRGGLDDRTNEAFRASGTYHVLALSGAQV